MGAAYRKKYCEAVLKHFSTMRENEKGVLVGAPSLISFAEALGVTLSDIARWRKSYPDFDSACEQAAELLRQLLIDAALSGRVNVSAAKFILASEFGMGASSGDNREGGEGLSAGDRELLSHLAERLFGEE